ncbi:MAG: NAD(P)/FAD-dependent oxidoreductase [Candidatus Methanoperedens sp.]|nr:NAD(P)/FAD-dependent oxidoreductase [Candidatus Methanoperedens sp.]
MKSTDAIIIGAGVGGLSAAAYLAQAGRGVIVLEQDRHIGGTAHVFRRSGFIFPTGPQSVTMPGYISDSLCELGVGPPCFIRDCFQVRRGSMDVMISVPLREISEQLSKIFPEEQKGIMAVINVLEEVMTALDVLKPEDLIEQAGTTNSAARVILHWGSIPARELVNSHLHDERLKDLLGSQGTDETEMSVVLLAQMWRFMSKEGIWYTRGGICEVPELLAMRVRAFGGEIRLGERVERILIHAGTAVGVELSGGARIRSHLVISDADYKETILGLLPHDVITADKHEEITRMPLTSSAYTIFLGVKRELVDICAFRGHHLLVKLKEGKPIPWELKRPIPEDFLQDEIWLSWWSRHDHKLAPPGCEALIIKVTAPFDHFAPFSGGGNGQHCEYYYSMKEEMAGALVSAASGLVPGLPDAVVVREVATPLTYKERGHRSAGSVAGWSWRFDDFPGQTHSLTFTPVPGLLMVGLQSFTRLFYGGMGTSLYSGRYAADIVLSGTE